MVTRETSGSGGGSAPHCPLDKNNHQLGPGVNRKKGQSCEQGVGKAGTGLAGVVQRAKRQPSWVADHALNYEGYHGNYHS